MSTIPTNDEQIRIEVYGHDATSAVHVPGTDQPHTMNACCGPTCCTSDVQTPVVTKVAAQPEAVTCCDTACCTPSL